ncbi:MAG: response regulator transcription factor [Prolixibacteraceae bacterium]
MTLLIVDDSADFRERIRNLALKHEKVQIVGEANDGVEAFRIIDAKEPNMIILDIRMPLMNGIQVLKKLRAKGSKIIVCMLTSYPYPQYKKKCLDLGADYFFNKSDDFEKINMILEMH